MFAHLHCHSPYSFLDGASDINTLLDRALEAGVDCLALTDHDNVSGAIEFCRKARERGIKPLLGAEVTVADHRGHLVLISENPAGYGNLCRLLTRAHLGSPRNQPAVDVENLRQHSGGLLALSGCRNGLIPSRLLRRQWREAESGAREYMSIFGSEKFFLEIQGDLLPGNRQLHRQMRDLGNHLGLQLAATNNVHYAYKTDFPVHDLLSCVRTRTRLSEVHPDRRMNAENYLKSRREMEESLGEMRSALKTTSNIARRCRTGITPSQDEYPRFVPPRGSEPGIYLRHLVYQGAAQRYGRLTAIVRERLEEELSIIESMDLSGYFLFVWDVVRYARKRGIRYAGRGSAADSAVAYCLFITEVDAVSRGHLFQRFINPERGEQPDIDIDFDARRRDEVIQYVINKYGREQVARVATFSTFRARSAVRDIGQVMEFAPAEIDRLAKTLPHLPADRVEMAVESLPEFRGKYYAGKYKRLFQAVARISGFPRHMGTHLGGLVISRRSLLSITALQRAAVGDIVCQLDKRGVEDAGLIKLDLLSLRTMSAIEDAVESIRLHDPGFDYDELDPSDSRTFSLISSGNTVGVFQLESPAQRALQRRLRPGNLEDIVASVALIRPGPIKGNMVEPFLARRDGREPVTYPHDALKPILEKTLGVVLFQEQVIEIATAVAGFTLGESDQLRRVMTHARSHSDMKEIGQKFVKRALERGVEKDVALSVLSYIESYASYGFCEAHAAAFGLTAYRTAYLLEHYPEHYLCGLMNQQPMGYYPLHTLGVEARRRGVEILPLDINESALEFEVREGGIRVPITLVKEVSYQEASKVVESREKEGRFESWDDFRFRAGVNREALENLILAGAFDSMVPNRRALLWKMADPSGDLADGVDDFTQLERLYLEHRMMNLFTSGHPLRSWRGILSKRGFCDSQTLLKKEDGAYVKVAGIPVCPHRPPTRSGKVVVFLSLEDEHGLIDITVFDSIYQRFGSLLFGDVPPVLEMKGRLSTDRGGFSVIASHIQALELKPERGQFPGPS